MKKTVLAVALTLVATLAQANGGPGHGDQGLAGPGGDGGGITVAADGTALVTQSVSTGTNTYANQLVAITPAGAVAWKVTLDNGQRDFVVSGTNVITVTETAATSTTAASSKLTALSIASGTTAWTLTIDGVVRELRPFNNGVYAVVVTPAATSGATPTRKLVAISNSGAILWSVTLN
jgi:hypothetical protein